MVRLDEWDIEELRSERRDLNTLRRSEEACMIDRKSSAVAPASEQNRKLENIWVGMSFRIAPISFSFLLISPIYFFFSYYSFPVLPRRCLMQCLYHWANTPTVVLPGMKSNWKKMGNPNEQ